MLLTGVGRIFAKCGILMMKLENKISNWMERHKKYIFISIFFGISVYFMMLSESLVNSYDGIWHTSNFVAGSWETSLGRGILYYIDRIRGGVVSTPLNSILALLIISITSALILDFFDKVNITMCILTSLLFVANSVTCVTLSYCFTSVGYGMAFLFSVLSVRFICWENKISGVLSGAFFVAMSLGCYQAYFGVICLLVLLQAMKMFLNCIKFKEILFFIMKSILVIIIGGFFYIVMSKVLLAKYGIGFAEYRGASDVSIAKILVSLPESVRLCYREFYSFFVTNKMQTSFDKTTILLAGIGLMMFICLCRHLFVIWHISKTHTLCFLACVCLIPLACNAVILLAGGGMSTLMSMGMVSGVVLLPMVLIPAEGKEGFFIKHIWYILGCMLLWVNILTVTNDQLALKQGKTATTELAETIVGELVSGGYLENGAEVALVGKPCESNLFAKRGAWYRANWYAKFGDWWIDAANNRKSWTGVLEECCSINLRLCSVEKYDELHQRGEFLSMPIFPARGSIKKIDGIVVVKVSDVY